MLRYRHTPGHRPGHARCVGRELDRDGATGLFDQELSNLPGFSPGRDSVGHDQHVRRRSQFGDLWKPPDKTRQSYWIRSPNADQHIGGRKSGPRRSVPCRCTWVGPVEVASLDSEADVDDSPRHRAARTLQQRIDRSRTKLRPSIGMGQPHQDARAGRNRDG